jgi:6-phosphogluconate dehydrogenase
MQIGVIGLGRMGGNIVPADVLSAALYTRFRSRGDHTFAEKILPAMRKRFGAHIEPKDGEARPS